MADETELKDLVERCAAQNGVSANVLRALIQLQDAFPDFTVWGAKSDFTRRVARILDAAASEAAPPS